MSESEVNRDPNLPGDHSARDDRRPARRLEDPTANMVPRRSPGTGGQSGPSHPTWPAALLMGGVVLLIVLIAVLDALR